MSEKPISQYLKVPFLSSSVSALLSLAVFPIDLVNTIAKSTPVQKTAKEVINSVYIKYGLKGFYKGSTLIVYEHFPSNFIYFFSYDYLNRKFVDHWEAKKYRARALIPMMTSFLSEISCLFIYVPLDTILTRMQSHNPVYNYKSVWDGIRSIYKNEGLLRFYYSSHLAIIYCLILTTTQFTNYEWFKSYYMRKTHKDKFGVMESFLGTFYSTSLAVLLSNPIDTLVIQHQMTDFEKNKHISTLSILKREYKERSLRVFTRNIGLRMLSLNAFGFATIPIYEIFRQKYGMNVEF